MLYVLKECKYATQAGFLATGKPGQMIDVLTKAEKDKLIYQGFCCKESPKNIPTPVNTLTANIFLETTPYYSGGRLMILSYAQCLSALGWDVNVVCPLHPKGHEDFPKNNNIRYIQGNTWPKGKLIITDGKGNKGKRAFEEKIKYPDSKLIVFNFETPNFLREFGAEEQAVYEEGDRKWLDIHHDLVDMWICCSDESRKYLLKYYDIKRSKTKVLYPCVNSHALENIKEQEKPTTPYVCIVGRKSTHKQTHELIDMLLKKKTPFDICVIGQRDDYTHGNNLHKVYVQQCVTETTKLTLMKHADVIAHPSKFEGFGMVPLESVAVGTKCVALSLPVYREHVNPPTRCKSIKHLARKCVDIIKRPVRIDINVRGTEDMKDDIKKLPYHNEPLYKDTVSDIIIY